MRHFSRSICANSSPVVSLFAIVSHASIRPSASTILAYKVGTKSSRIERISHVCPVSGPKQRRRGIRMRCDANGEKGLNYENVRPTLIAFDSDGDHSASDEHVPFILAAPFHRGARLSSFRSARRTIEGKEIHKGISRRDEPAD